MTQSTHEETEPVHRVVQELKVEFFERSKLPKVQEDMVVIDEDEVMPRGYSESFES
jgi:hypothetical protein